MSVSSLQSAFSLGVQADKTTAATTHHTTLATVSGIGVEFDEASTEDEHPGPATDLALQDNLPTVRTGYLAPVNATFVLRPRFLPRLLQAFGVAWSSANNTTHWTHTGTLTTRALTKYMTAIHKFSNGSALERKVTGVRGEQLQITGDLERLRGVFTGVGLVEGNASGSETKVAEIATEISVYSGSIAFDILGDAISPVNIRGIQQTITQEIDREDRVHFSSGRADLPILRRRIEGELQNIDLDTDSYAIYLDVVRGSTSGTAPSLVMATGALTYTYQSLTNITGAAVPFRYTVTIPTVEYRLPVPDASGAELVRLNLQWRMIATATPITFVIVNDQADVYG